MKTLAIKGHPTRGNEVIELLEMMGGYKDSLLKDEDIYDDNYFYFILAEENNAIDGYPLKYKDKVDEDYIIFTLEEFLEKYPFKVGDKVHIYVQNADIDGICDIEVAEITSMRWNPTIRKIAYKMKNINREFYKEEIKCKVDDSNKPSKDEVNMKDKFRKDFCERCGSQRCSGKDGELEYCERFKTWSGESKAVISGIYLNSCDYADEVELNLGDYEIEVRGSRTYAVKQKSKYPTTFEECLNMLYCKSILRTIIGHKAELLLNLEKLLICLDAYYKIAGEEMGLGKPWEPNWTTFEGMPAIFRFRYNIVCDSVKNQHCLLVFPTEEMRDAFYKNFKDLIEQCKELL